MEGKTRRTNANDVIRIGRKRNSAASIAASVIAPPVTPRVYGVHGFQPAALAGSPSYFSNSTALTVDTCGRR
jgi:hypothetical protein